MSEQTEQLSYKKGLRDGLPIALGYLSVSFTFGITAVGMGIPPLAAILISMTNLTSAGQVQGINIIAAGGGYIEMALAQLVINMRYALMGISLSQKLDNKYNLIHRIISSFGITDEIFAVASGQKADIPPRYMYGLITLPYIFWATGTAAGALLGAILPESIQAALGIAIYGMFIAIVIPPAKKSRGILWVALFSALLSSVIAFISQYITITSGISVIICAVIAAAFGAAFFPQKTGEVTADE
ncbi:MAG: AzlC family ABC transporter permease [Oscillospiraceae bacterium]|nr:AzlC family ABC transporter permease [Oscillospiraceae bacterium]